MKFNNSLKSAYVALFCMLCAANARAAAGSGTSVQTFFSTIQSTMQTISITIVTIAVMWAGYKVLFQGDSMREIAKPLLGGIMIGSATWIAGLFVGGN